MPALKIEVENVGGFQGIAKFELEKGLNLIVAPNATGKTSFVRALELMALPNDELKGKGHYMNLIVDSARGQARVKLIDTETKERRFRRVGDSLTCVEGNPFFSGETKVPTVCFAVPGNALIARMLAGEPIREYVEELSDSLIYENAVAILGSFRRDLDRQHRIFRDDLIRLEQLQDNLQKEEGDLLQKKKELENLPKIDEKAILDDEKVRAKYDAKQAEKRRINDHVHSLQTELQDLQSGIEELTLEIKRFENRRSEIGRDQKRINAELDKVVKELRDTKSEKTAFQQQLAKIDDQLRIVNDNFQKRRKYGEEERCQACGQPLTLEKLQKWEKELRKSQEDFRKKLRAVKRTIEDLQDEEQRLHRDLQELQKVNDQLKSKERTRATRESQRSKKQNEHADSKKESNELAKELEKIWANIDEESLKLFQQISQLQDRIRDRETRINGMKRRIRELTARTAEADRIVEKIEFVDAATQHMSRRKLEVMESVREAFDQNIDEIYSKLGFRDFESIEIAKDYTIYIKRPGYEDPWPLDALSTSERITLALTFLVAGKQEYLPDFPFFILDELVTSYDPGRTEQLKEYLANVADYVLLTQLAKEEEVGPKVAIQHI